MDLHLESPGLHLNHKFAKAGLNTDLPFSKIVDSVTSATPKTLPENQLPSYAEAAIAKLH